MALKGLPSLFADFRRKYGNCSAEYILESCKPWIVLSGMTYQDISDVSLIPVKTLQGWFEGYRVPPRYTALYLLFVLSETCEYV